METSELNKVSRLIPYFLEYPRITSRYDAEADVLYLTFDETRVADDSEVTDDDVILRYAGEELIGITITHASRRAA
jgi:uncharacterized protein YuzE